jgi:hypothetical protein
LQTLSARRDHPVGAPGSPGVTRRDGAGDPGKSARLPHGVGRELAGPELADVGEEPEAERPRRPGGVEERGSPRRRPRR